jgi:thiol-disulfide isomerase/thioredoxin
MVKIKYLILIIFIVLVVGCSETVENEDEIVFDDSDEPTKKALEQTNDNSESKVGAPKSNVLFTTQLTDARTGNSFTLNDFKDKPIVLESFAVWCPTCTKQQREIGKLHELVGDKIVSIALNTDPNEDISLVKEHVEKNNFDWRYAVAPKEVVESLIDQFTIKVVNAPSAPVIILCNGESYFLKNGVKSAEEIKSEIDTKC